MRLFGYQLRLEYCAVIAGAIFIVASLVSGFYYGFSATEPEPEHGVFEVSQYAVFEPVLPDVKLNLPYDFASHDEYQYEWWHYFANLEDKQGNEYGVQWIYYRIVQDERTAKGWQSPQFYVAYTVVTSREQRWQEQRLARGGIGQAGLRYKPFGLWIDNWRWRAISISPLPSLLDIETDHFSVALTSALSGPYIFDGYHGYQRKHDLLPIAAYSLQAPFVRVSGQLKLDGRLIDVAGNAWLHKEWGSDRAHLQDQKQAMINLRLDDGRSLMVQQNRLIGHPAYTYATLSYPDGKSLDLTDQEIVMRPTEQVILKNGKVLPLKWHISSAQYGFDIAIEPLRSEQWLSFAIPYWQGPIVSSSSNKSIGFLQLSGY